jgi:hypothetical protein
MLRQGLFGVLVGAIALPLLLCGTAGSRANELYRVTTPAGCVTPPAGLENLASGLAIQADGQNRRRKNGGYCKYERRILLRSCTLFSLARGSLKFQENLAAHFPI